jgi:dTDP-4-dehydrorhamnose reductase
MNVLVIGKDGQLGSELVKLIPNSVGTSRKNNSERFLDLKNLNAIEDFILKEMPDVVVNAAALTDVDSCENNKNNALIINAKAVKSISRACSVAGTYFIHVSTDYVFDGEKGNYSEEDSPNPINYYGFTKAIGEAYALSYDDSLVIRTSGVYGIKMNFPLFVVKTLRENGTVNCIDSYYSPIHATLLAEAIKQIIGKRIYGILNVSGDRISRYDFALKIKETLGIETGAINLVKVVQNLNARRPHDSSLDNSKALKMLSTKFNDVERSIKYLEKVK